MELGTMIGSRQVLAYQACHLEHGDLLFAEYFGQLLIGIDVAFVLGVLQIVGLDVVPQLLDHFSTGQRAGTHYGSQFGAGFQRLHECCIRRTLFGDWFICFA